MTMNIQFTESFYYLKKGYMNRLDLLIRCFAIRQLFKTLFAMFIDDPSTFYYKNDSKLRQLTKRLSIYANNTIVNVEGNGNKDALLGVVFTGSRCRK